MNPLPRVHRLLRRPFTLFTALWAVILFAGMAGCGDKARQAQEQPVDKMFRKDGELTFTSAEGKVLATIDIEVADDQEKRSAGLMGRPSMRDHDGMLFIFENPQPLSFWMMNTMIPLDMLFIDTHKTVITLHRNTTPYTTDSYSSTSDGQYVVEVNGGFCDRYGIDVGAIISWKIISP